MSSLDAQKQEMLRRRWQSQANNFYSRLLSNTGVGVGGGGCGVGASGSPVVVGKPRNLQSLSGEFDENLVASVIPQVTVVLEGRAICQRISLQKHGSYKSLAKALRKMFVDGDNQFGEDHDEGGHDDGDDGEKIDLSNAVPGHIVAYEDMENDLLLAGDLNWKDFVKVAKRIRILPVKANSRKVRPEDI